MPGKTIGQNMNRGFAGTVSRAYDAHISARPAKEIIPFGVPLVRSGDGVAKFGPAHTATDFIGVSVREVKTAADYAGEKFQYEEGEPCDIMTRGDMAVVCDAGTPVEGAAVLVDKTKNAFTATASGDTVALEGVIWSRAGVDADKVGEIAVLSRKM